MKIVLKVWSSNENDSAGCDFVLIDLTSEVALRALRRIQILRHQKKFDPEIDEIYYWTHFIECFFSPWVSVASAEREVEGASFSVAELLETLRIEDTELAFVPATFEVPPSQVADAECEQMIVRETSIAFIAIPKHASFYVQSTEIPIPVLEAAVAEGSSTGTPTTPL